MKKSNFSENDFNLRLNIWGKLLMCLEISQWVGFNGVGFVIFRLKLQDILNFE
jgi:hypothetical protein